MARAVDAAEAVSSTTGPALVAALEAAEAAAGATNQQESTQPASAATTGDAGDQMEVDTAPLGAALTAGLKGVVEHEPAAALKTAASALLKRLA